MEEEEDAKPNYEALIAGQIPSGFCRDTCKAVRISLGAVPYGLPNKIEEEEDAKPNYEALIVGQTLSGFCRDTCKAVRISFGAAMSQRTGSDPFLGRAHRSVGATDTPEVSRNRDREIIQCFLGSNPHGVFLLTSDFAPQLACQVFCKAVRISFRAGMIKRSGSDPFLGRAHRGSVGGFLYPALMATVVAATMVSDSRMIQRSGSEPFIGRAHRDDSSSHVIEEYKVHSCNRNGLCAVGFMDDHYPV
ncbi:hypothetical protein Vadar_023159 [Vaccinium darrowii]|uniref:Uncharacterized protein n=1 Tax=Vaccinium darrowii TaxID=229202 RepID=A0ACB7YPD6_9ERIC|nr:hypothetical protein Vadar_023159 [Vaccinium darrowii]